MRTFDIQNMTRVPRAEALPKDLPKIPRRAPANVGVCGSLYARDALVVCDIRHPRATDEEAVAKVIPTASSRCYFCESQQNVVPQSLVCCICCRSIVVNLLSSRRGHQDVHKADHHSRLQKVCGSRDYAHNATLILF